MAAAIYAQVPLRAWDKWTFLERPKALPYGVHQARAQLSTTSAFGTSLRWTLADGVSYRAYELGKEPEGSFCVSTRSHEAVIVLEGEVDFEFGPERRQVHVRADEAGVLSRGLAHRSHSTPQTRFLILDLPPSIPLPEGVFVLGRDVLQRRLLDVAAELWRAERAHSIRDELRQLTALLSRATAIAPGETHRTRRMLRVKAFLEAHYDTSLTLESIATAFRLDRHYLMRSFKQNFGVPPLSYVQFLRTEHFVWESLGSAARGEANHTRTALEAGFGDYPTFSRRIHAQFGKPPSRLIEAALG